ncbi:hypothetical protein HN865_05060 [Candidatus Woesearchaeota archaeon]|nr:hypothetical protein [Candidatus Woesearchaeota archaeon]
MKEICTKYAIGIKRNCDINFPELGDRIEPAGNTIRELEKTLSMEKIIQSNMSARNGHDTGSEVIPMILISDNTSKNGYFEFTDYYGYINVKKLMQEESISKPNE